MAEADRHDGPWLIDELVPSFATVVEEIGVGRPTARPDVAHFFAARHSYSGRRYALYRLAVNCSAHPSASDQEDVPTRPDAGAFSAAVSS